MSNNSQWPDKKEPIFHDTNAFNRAVSNVRKTQSNMQAMRQTQSNMQALKNTATISSMHLPSAQSFAAPQSPAGLQPFAALGPPQVPAEACLFASKPARPEAVQLTEDEIEQYVFFDRTTRAFSFRYIIQALRHEVTRAVHYRRPLSILVVAVPNLKRIQAEYGPAMHDLALTTVAYALLSSCGPVDLVGRYTEDRHILLYPERPLQHTNLLAARLVESFTSMSLPYQLPLQLNPSIGIATHCEFSQDLESLIAIADLGADMVVQRGGNGYCFAPDEM